ncbi:uncharacterized protein EMH_0074570 [Eimeria mitis]|uniref:Uncharacterized protein n=1 Tax=Eimeria mitis TaxID=44415 RepID=U6KJ78_9EIME|nr:uncharacterized protein EMH_0074570 [Eimeria mitis]CDJ35513.1 hypothetical protein, conserved [Eimeria mitis]
MAQQPQDKLEAAAEAAGAAAAAAAASVWRFFEDDTAAKRDPIRSINGSNDDSAHDRTVQQQDTPAGATAAKLAQVTDLAPPAGPDTSTVFSAAPAYESNGNLTSSDSKSSSSDSSTTATSKDTSPMGPRGNADEPNAPAACSSDNSSSCADNVNEVVIADGSATGSRSISSNECNNGSGGDSSSCRGGDFAAALGLIRNAASRVLSGSSQQQEQEQQGPHQQRQLPMQGTTEPPHNSEGLQSGRSTAVGAVQTVTAAAAASPGAAAAAAVVAAAVAAADAAIRGSSNSEPSSSSSNNSTSNTAHYQTSTTPEAVQVAHRLPPQQQQGKIEQSLDASTTNTALGTAAEAAGSAPEVTAAADTNQEQTPEGRTSAAPSSAEATAAAGIHKLVETRFGYATDIGGQLQHTAQQTAAKKHPEEGKLNPTPGSLSCKF